MTLKNIILLNTFLFSTLVLNSMEDPRHLSQIYKKDKRTYDSTLLGQENKEEISRNNKSLKGPKIEEQTQDIVIHNDSESTDQFSILPDELTGLIFAANIDEILQSSDIYNFYSNIHKYIDNLRKVCKKFDQVVKNIPIEHFRNLEHFVERRAIGYFALEESQMSENQLNERCEDAKNFYHSNPQYFIFYSNFSDEIDESLKKRRLIHEDKKLRTLRIIIANPKIVQCWDLFLGLFGKDLAIIKMLLNSGIRYRDQIKSFDWDAAENAKKLFTLICNHVLNSDTDNNNINELLCEAIILKDINFIKACMKRGASINYRNEHENTPLIVAAIHNNDEAIKLLLDAGANTEDRGEDGTTSLMQAAYFGSLNSLKTLIEHNADVHATDDFDNTLLYYALSQGIYCDRNPEIVKILLSYKVSLTNEDTTDYSLVLEALAHADIEDLRLLVESGINLNIQSDNRSTTFFVMIKHGSSVEAIELLLKMGIDVNAADCDGNFALMLAVINLQDHSDEKDKENCSKVIRLLLDYGANVNILDANRNTPLMIAAANGWTEIVELLLEKKVDAYVKNKKGETASDIAIAKEHREIAILILKYLISITEKYILES